MSKDLGGCLLRNVKTIFSDSSFVKRNEWDKIEQKIRTYTKYSRNASNITHTVEAHNTLERGIVFSTSTELNSRCFYDYMSLVKEVELENNNHNQDDVANTRSNMVNQVILFMFP